jgi:DNA-binding transcriptional ArsR family regulator
MELQELVARARLLFEGAAKRRQVFELINGKRSAKEIARKSGKKLSRTLHDLQKMRDVELILPRQDGNGSVVKHDNSVVYERARLLKHLSSSYFNKREVHHFQDGVYYRRGTNVFKTKADETRKLH